MKKGKRLTYNVKRLLSARGLDVNDWLIKLEDNNKYLLIHKKTGELKEIEK